MVKVCGVRFPNSGKEYFFDPGELNLVVGRYVIVETARGTEYGKVTMAPTDMDEEEIVHPLKRVLRSASESDRKRYEDNRQKREKAMVVCQEKIDKHKLDMKLVDVEYTFDRAKIIFYFTADARVDFRELVRDLASVFDARIELRQIGVRDEAKLLGGIGECGRGLCCHEWMADFIPVSVKMAKTQNLSLNPTKISGMCGRLMCCLKFENEVYQELGKGMPRIGERVITPEGPGVVTDVNILLNRVRCRLMILERNSDGEEYEKLGSEMVAYPKEDIQRADKKAPPQKKVEKPVPERKVEKEVPEKHTEKVATDKKPSKSKPVKNREEGAGERPERKKARPSKSKNDLAASNRNPGADVESTGEKEEKAPVKRRRRRRNRSGKGNGGGANALGKATEGRKKNAPSEN